MWVRAWSPCTWTDPTIRLSYSELFPGIQPCTSATQNSFQVSNHLPQILKLTPGLQTSASDTQKSLQVSRSPKIRLNSELSPGIQPSASATCNSLQVSTHPSPLLRTLSRYSVICLSYSELSPGLQRPTSAAQNSLQVSNHLPKLFKTLPRYLDGFTASRMEGSSLMRNIDKKRSLSGLTPCGQSCYNFPMKMLGLRCNKSKYYCHLLLPNCPS
jgi:hypothetical protein